MRPFAILAVVSLSVVAGGCRETQAPVAGTSFAAGSIKGGGFDDANNVGSIIGTQWSPRPWRFPSDIGGRNERCYVEGFCAVGNTYAVFGTLGSPNNSDPNPGSCIVSDCFGVLSTVNFVDVNFTGTNGVLRSGIEAFFPEFPLTEFATNAGWILNFDYAFLTAPPVTASGGDAFAVVLLDYDADGDPATPDETVEAFRVSRSDLQSGEVPVRADGCGSNGLGGVTSDYPLCTGWQNQSVDVSFLAGKKLGVRIYVDEGGRDAGVATSFAIDNLRFDETVLVGPVTGPADPVTVNTPVDVSAPFTDTEAGVSHTATIDWGDGTSTAGAITDPVGTTPGSVSGSHTYQATGAYSVTIAVSDGSAPDGTATFDFIMVVEPTARAVTGRGAIESPAGAFAPRPRRTGRARFAFLSRLESGAAVPTGRTAFEFPAVCLLFKSDRYQQMVIAGAKAQYSGVGKMNGVGGFGFFVSVIDGQAPGGGGVDKFRIKIWKRRTGRVVYDNQVGAPESADPRTVLRVGNIAITN